MTKFRIIGAVFAATISVVNVGVAQVVFSDNFDAENSGVGTTNYVGFANWSVSDGTVDLIGNFFFDSYPGNGLYLDLDGSSANAGVLTSTPIPVVPGAYTLQFDLGTIPGFAANTMTVSLGPEYSEVFGEADAGMNPNFGTISRTFNVASPGNLSLVFDHQGGDNFGLVIDNVRLSVVPEPAAIVLLACASLAPFRRCRRRN